MKKWKDKLKGGKADKMNPCDFNQKELKRGMKHEGEHSSDKHVTMEIAMDHLAEDTQYYRKLDKMERKKK